MYQNTTDEPVHVASVILSGFLPAYHFGEGKQNIHQKGGLLCLLTNLTP